VLLAYLSESLKGGWRPGEAELNKVLAALPASAKDKLGPVRELWKKGIEEQRARLAEFEPLLTGGNAYKGRKVFFSQKVPCATCHRIAAEGGQIGPDLTKIGAIRAGRDILESIVLPSSTIAQGFESYVIVTADGRVVTGIIARQTADTLFVRDSSGAELRLRRDQVQEMSRSPTSLMPEGLDKQMSRDEFRDLLAFLQGLK
jgi:putative heme-binding domain-containing protein